MIDNEGRYFIPGYTIDIDLYYRGNETWLLEYKIRVQKDDIVWLVKLRELAKNVYRIRNLVVVLVALLISPGLVELAESFGIKVIIGKKKLPEYFSPSIRNIE